MVSDFGISSGTIIVLGTNTGIGFEAAKHFASMTPGWLILACRSPSKGQAVVDSTLSIVWLEVQSVV
ncbi:hypothetical protein B0H13DRAFT_1718040 [Mycena leptocephala]|nr:hypothetical protein B0H13DRAFT_1718040 [Mycena leptocephala]